MSAGAIQRWAAHYEGRTDDVRPLVPEGFVARLLLSAMPRRVIEAEMISGADVLDLSCGNGRNLPLLAALGAHLTATEIDASILEPLRTRFPDIRFEVGTASALPFPDACFDGVLACNSMYYLEPGHSFRHNLDEIARVLRPGAWLLGSFMGPDHSALDSAQPQPDDSHLITSDRLDLRNGTRMQAAASDSHVAELLQDHFINCQVGRSTDDFLGFRRDLFYFVAERSRS